MATGTTQDVQAHHARVRAELARVLFRSSPWPVAANFGVVALSLLVLWDHAPRERLLVWAALVCATAVARLAMSIFMEQRPRDAAETLRWAWAYSALAGITGTLWGALGIWIADPAHPATLVFIGVVLGGLVGGSVASLSTFPPAFYLYSLPTMAPFPWLALSQQSPVFAIATLLFCLNFLYAHVVFRKAFDATELRFRNEDLLDQLGQEKARVEAASQAKTTFLASASHDLRQPAHALSLFVQVLAQFSLRPEGIGQAEAARLANRMQSSLDGLNDLLSALLDVSRLDAGLVSAQRVPIDLADAFAAMHDSWSPLAIAKGLELRVRNCGIGVISDPVLFQRILGNLVSNAIKYTASGGILVAARRRGIDVSVEVWDTGSGIPADRQEEIFDEFVQLENPARDRSSGLGLGLAIVRRAAAILGHPVTLKSRPGRGSCFSFRAPGIAIEPPALAPSAPRSAPGCEGACILVIDDEASVRHATCDMLSFWGFEAIAVRDAAEALRALAGENVAPDLILADYRLAGGQTGAEAIARVNATLPRPVPGLIVTGDTSPDRLRDAAASGHRILHKPVQPERLRETIGVLLHGTALSKGRS